MYKRPLLQMHHTLKYYEAKTANANISCMHIQYSFILSPGYFFLFRCIVWCLFSFFVLLLLFIIQFIHARLSFRILLLPFPHIYMH